MELPFELAKLGRLCKLVDMQISDGAPAPMVAMNLRNLARLSAEIAVVLETTDAGVVQADTRIGDNTAQLLAESLHPEIPDTLPEEWRDE